MIEVTKADDNFCPNCYVFSDERIFRVTLSHKTSENLCYNCLIELSNKLNDIFLSESIRSRK